jgi:esterase/lipase superfamily enzyme
VQVPDVNVPLPEVKVYYATDRGRTGSTVPAAFYGDRARTTLEFGIAYVTIPLPVHTRGEFEEPKWWKLEFKVNPARHVFLRSVSPFANTEDFYARLRQDVATRSGKEIFVFVHGFNVGFDEAARRTAQIAYDLDLDMVPVLFSWTSGAKMLKYGADEDMSDQVVDKLQPFLQALATQTGAGSIHLIAHSLGNRFLARALQKLDDKQAFEGRPLFNQVIMAAPDIKLDAFEQVFARSIRKAGCRTTLYFSKEDRALWISAFKHANDRTGARPPMVDTKGWLDAIDASAVDLKLLGVNHSYYGTRQVLEDMKQVLRRVATPRRSLVASPGAPSGDYWKFEVSKRMPAIDKASPPKLVACR